jgi:hypothetical protein
VNHPLSVTSQYEYSLPAVNRKYLPAVAVHSLPQAVNSDQSGRKRAYILNAPPQQYLKPLDEDSKDPFSSRVVDLGYLRSIFLYPLGYVRGSLIAAYQWAQGLLPLDDSPSPKVDLYV